MDTESRGAERGGRRLHRSEFGGRMKGSWLVGESGRERKGEAGGKHCPNGKKEEGHDIGTYTYET